MATGKLRDGADVAMIGLAAMGRNLAVDMADHGSCVAVCKRHASVMEAFVSRHALAPCGFVCCQTLESLTDTVARAQDRDADQVAPIRRRRRRSPGAATRRRADSRRTATACRIARCARSRSPSRGRLPWDAPRRLSYARRIVQVRDLPLGSVRENAGELVDSARLSRAELSERTRAWWFVLA